jgi:hypothetical protein
MKFTIGDRVRFNNTDYPEWVDMEGTVTGAFTTTASFVKLDGKVNPNCIGNGHTGDYAFQNRNLTPLGTSLEQELTTAMAPLFQYSAISEKSS